LLAGGVSIAQQALAEGLVDEVVLHVVPKLVGKGVRLFGDAQANLRCIEAIQGEGALHLSYVAS
jgi:dihydrofolate reductase